jgi:hypothetical protein
MSQEKNVSPWKRRIGEKMCPHEKDKAKETMWPKGENGPRDSSLGRGIVPWGGNGVGEMILP